MMIASIPLFFGRKQHVSVFDLVISQQQQQQNWQQRQQQPQHQQQQQQQQKQPQQQEQQQQLQPKPQQQHFNQNFQAGSIEPLDVPAQYDNIQPGHVLTEGAASSSEKAMSVVSRQNDNNEALSHTNERNEK